MASPRLLCLSTFCSAAAAAQVDSLLDSNAVRSKVSKLADVTHIFHCAYMTTGSDQYKDSMVGRRLNGLGCISNSTKMNAATVW